MKEKVIIFDGTDLSGFNEFDSMTLAPTGNEPKWEVKDGVMTTTKYDVYSKYEYGDAHVHVEFNLPYMPDKEGQHRANSGLFVHGCYELQILDSSMNEVADKNDCGALYDIAAPLVNACKAPGEWQTYDVYIKAAKLNEDGSVARNAVMTVFLNGQIIHNNLEIPRYTPAGSYDHVVERGPVFLQDHGCPVSFRNIWVQPLD